MHVCSGGLALAAGGEHTHLTPDTTPHSNTQGQSEVGSTATGCLWGRAAGRVLGRPFVYRSLFSSKTLNGRVSLTIDSDLNNMARVRFAPPPARTPHGLTLALSGLVRANAQRAYSGTVKRTARSVDRSGPIFTVVCSGAVTRPVTRRGCPDLYPLAILLVYRLRKQR